MRLARVGPLEGAVCAGAATRFADGRCAQGRLRLARQLHNPVVMIIAIPVWSGRVSPVFDVARKVLIAEIDSRSGELVAEGTHVLNPARPASTLIELGVGLLVCSAISSAVEAMLWANGVEVVSDICGSPDEIMAALAAGDMELTRFRSPGSRRRPRSSPSGPAPQRRGGPGTQT